MAQTKEERLAKHRIYNTAHRKQLVAYNAAHRNKKNASQRARWPMIRDKRLARGRAYYSAHREEILRHNRAYSAAHKSEYRNKVLAHYGGKCTCCDENTPVFLAIDHINGGGNKHKREIKRGGEGFYRWIVKNNFPKGFQILCHNCNQAKHILGHCPHQGKLQQAGI